MKISDLIKALAKAQADYGDVEVYCVDDTATLDSVIGVEPYYKSADGLTWTTTASDREIDGVVIG